jgi:L-serine dehydratase
MYSIKTLYKIGPGPSSSHTIGPRNAVRYVLKYRPRGDYYKMYLYGSLALTGKGHLLDKIVDQTFDEIPHEMIFDLETNKEHPNTMFFEIIKDNKIIDTVTIYSIGGGIISIKGEDKKHYKEIYPHSHFDDIKKYCKENNLSLIDYIYKFEDEDIKEYGEKIYQTMMDCISSGLQKEGKLPGAINVYRKAKEIYSKGIPEESSSRREKRLVSAYAFAVSEENASGGMVVTAPTCGSSGIIPSLVRYYEEQGYSHKSVVESLLVAGLFGLLIKENASISGAECGCQAEVGSASSMGAAFVANIKGQNIDLIERAAEIAMEHSLGLTCDPIGGYVLIPCIERNAIGALRSIECASITDFIDSTSNLISFDMVIKTMYQTGRDLNKAYRETATGGLAALDLNKEDN